MVGTATTAAGGSSPPRTPNGRSRTALGRWAPRAPRDSHTQVSPNPKLDAASSTTIKANPTQAVEVWRSLAGTKYYGARGSFSITGDVSHDVLNLVFKKMVRVSDVSAKQLQALSDFSVEAFDRLTPL